MLNIMWVLWWWHMSIQVHCQDKEAIFTMEVTIISGLSKAWQSRLNVKAMFIVSFSCWDLMLYVFVRRGETLNQELYLIIGWCLQKAVWKNDRNSSRNTVGCFPTTTLLHTHHSVQTFLTKLISSDSTSTLQPWSPPSPHFSVLKIES
jgi:hypothetical protein